MKRFFKAHLARSFVIIFVISFIFMVGLSALLDALNLPGAGMDETRLSALINLLWYTMLFGLFSWLGFTYLWRNQWTVFRHHFRRHLLMVLLGLFLLFTFNLWVAQFMIAMGFDLGSANQDALIAMAQAHPLTQGAVIVMAVLFAPLVEELVYRKGVFEWAEKKGGMILAFTLNTFLFGLMHVLFDLGNFFSILPYLAAGAVLTYIYLLSQRVIWVPILVHMSYNLISLLVIFSALQERFSGI